MDFETMQNEVCDELGISLTDIALNKLFTLTQLKRWLNLGKNWALNYKRWPFLENKDTDAIDATGTYPYQAGMKTNSIWLITVAGKKFDKIRYEDYLQYLEDDPDGDDKVWAEYDRDIFINGNACSVGNAIIMHGFEAIDDLSTGTETTPFAAAEPTGDEAIVLYAVAKALKKKKQAAEARISRGEAGSLLDAIWDRIMEAKPREVTKSRPLFRRMNVLEGTTGKTQQEKIGNF